MACDRLPWAELEGAARDNFVSLATLDWQLHIYGTPTRWSLGAVQSPRAPLSVFFLGARARGESRLRKRRFVSDTPRRLRRPCRTKRRCPRTRAALFWTPSYAAALQAVRAAEG